MSLTADQAWKLLSNNYDAAVDGALDTSGDPSIVATLTTTRAIIASPH